MPATPLSALGEWSWTGSGGYPSAETPADVAPMPHSDPSVQPRELSEKSSEKATVPPLQALELQAQVASLPQCVAQAPQWAGSLESWASQPFAELPSQFA